MNIICICTCPDLLNALVLGLHMKTRGLGDQKDMGGGLGSRLKPRLSLQPWVSPCYPTRGHIKTPKAGD